MGSMTKSLQLWVAAVAVSAVCGSAYAASFDCKLAKTSVEKAVCADKDLSAADDKLAAAYKAALAAAPADVQVDIRANQRDWTRLERNQCAVGTPQPSQEILVSCLTNAYKAQISALTKWVTQVGGTTFVQRWKSERAKSSDASSATMAEDPGYGTLTDTWPEALNSAPDWKTWNAEVKSKTLGTAKLDADSDSDVTATIDAVTPQIVAASIENDFNGHGAAHPGESSVQLNWMLKEHRALRVADVFKAGTNWAATIEARCMASIKTDVGADYEDYLGKAKFAGALYGIVQKPTNWQLTPQGLTIVFQDYEVEPHAARPGNVTVPWSALQAYLNPGFVVPR